MKLLPHLKRDQPAETPSTQQVGSVGLHHAHFFYVVCRHFFDVGMWQVPAIEASRLKTIDRALRRKLARQGMEEKDSTSSAVDTEKWRLRSLRLNRNQRCPSGRGCVLLAQEGRQRLDRGRLK